MTRRLTLFFALALALSSLAPAWAQQPTGTQFNTTAPAPAAGGIVAHQADQSGNLLTFSGVQFKAGAAWTSATGLNTLQYPNGTTTGGQLLGVAGIVVQLDQTTTLTGGAVTFQGTYDNVNWISVPQAAINIPASWAPVTNPYTFAASTNKSIVILLQGMVNIRANLSTVITGTGSVTFNWALPAVAPIQQVIGYQSPGNTSYGTNRLPTLPCINQTDPANGAAWATGTDGAPSCGTDGNLWVSIQPALRPASYVASKSFAGSSTTDNAVLPGNATNTVLVTRVIVTCDQTTAGILTINLVKRSAADTSGTSGAMTVVPDDSTFAAGSSAPLSYTGTGPTVGTTVGNVDTALMGCNAPATTGQNGVYVLDRRMKPIVLRGTAQQLAVNFGGAITGGNLAVTYEWQEVKTITP